MQSAEVEWRVVYDDSNQWRERAACLCADPELFFPPSETGPSGPQIWQAKQICHACPVKWACLAWALRNSVTDGIWGGSTQSERLALLGHPTRHQRSLPLAPRQRRMQ
jgi:WhiB family transcriptional regulator, redox-sensing transcriptional regulator